MNEKINKLWDQAWDDNTPLSIIKEKFAELIVRECIECVENTDKNMMFTADVAGHVGAAHSRSIRQIKEHFGVEE
jgi:hypothetical protein